MINWTTYVNGDDLVPEQYTARVGMFELEVVAAAKIVDGMVVDGERWRWYVRAPDGRRRNPRRGVFVVSSGVRDTSFGAKEAAKRFVRAAAAAIVRDLEAPRRRPNHGRRAA